MQYTIAGQTYELDKLVEGPDLLEYTPEEKAIFNKAIIGQPSHRGFSQTGFDASGKPIPYSLNAHSIKPMKNLLVRSGFTSGNMLEIGFNLGYSASIWLHLLPEVYLTSVDISDKAETLAGAEAVRKKYPDRFQFICADSGSLAATLPKNYFGLAFIDGDHTEAGIVRDIQMCLDIGIKTMLFDDVLPKYGMTIPALAKFPVKEFEIHGNMGIGIFV